MRLGLSESPVTYRKIHISLIWKLNNNKKNEHVKQMNVLNLHDDLDPVNTFTNIIAKYSNR